jgi:hypothetical protein
MADSEMLILLQREIVCYTSAIRLILLYFQGVYISGILASNSSKFILKHDTATTLF